MKTRRWHREFNDYFDVQLNDYWLGQLGFHITKFDDNCIKSPDGKSMRQTIIDNYSQEACDLVEELMSIDYKIIDEEYIEIQKLIKFYERMQPAK